ncbi:MAG TPA: SDR family NAD(P)-dependent oxidoreductase [Candidatus Bathyarchaeia archaeon]|nr:SDR family NAD(P)-dependent oxidoreductase [Candidatus Bathyarchaeia archaeon]
MNYSGKVVVITGASSGIGKEAAKEFAKLHASLALVSRDRNKLEDIAKELSKYKTEILICQCDVSQKEQVNKMSKEVLEKFATIDVLVNNAGFGIYNTIKDTKIEEIESQMNTNYFGMVYCTKTFLPKMLENKSGHIVNVASVAASFGIPAMASYCASKFAMLGFSESLYHELRGTGVGITVVSPIMVRTNFFNHNSFGKMPRYTMSLSANTVAKAVVRASSSPRLEIVVPQVIRIAIWMKQTFPYAINLIVGGIFRKSVKTN